MFILQVANHPMATAHKARHQTITPCKGNSFFCTGINRHLRTSSLHMWHLPEEQVRPTISDEVMRAMPDEDPKKYPHPEDAGIFPLFSSRFSHKI